MIVHKHMSAASEIPLEPGKAALTSQANISSNAILFFHLFGTPNIEFVGRHLDIPRRQVRALLYRLAVRFQEVSRQHLAFLFWPDASDTRAHRNLSHLLTHLRNALPDPDLLLTTEDHVCLDARRVWSDSAAFEQLCAAEESMQSPFTVLQKAVSLYHGPLLASFSLPGCVEFEDWLLLEQRNFEQRCLAALATLVNRWDAVGDYPQAIEYARRYLALDDLAEDMHRRLIIFYARAGDRTAALHQFEICTAALERDLGVDPLSETRAAYQTVLNGKLPSPQSGIRASKRPSLPSLTTPLVGREEALASLRQLFAEAQASRGQIVLLSGEAGMGKSRLVRELIAQLGNQTIVLAASAYPAISKPPYQPLVEALRTALGNNVPGADASAKLFSHCSPVWLAEVSRLLPELRDLCPGLPVPLPGQPDEVRTRLFEALSQFIQSLTATCRPILLALDDLPWADSATLEWLTYFSQRLRDCPIMFLGTFRSEEAEAVRHLRNCLQPLGILSQIALTGLDPASTLQVLHHFILPTPGDEDLARRLHRATGGNPFFLLETLSALSEAGRLQADLHSLEDFPLPESVRHALDTRLGALTAGARQVLEAAAVLGLRFRFDWVRLTSGRSEPETIDALEELVARQLLIEDGMEYHFVHELVCRAVEAGLSPMRRVLLHRRAARSLERLTPTAVGTLAQHFDAGGEAEKALHYYELAAQKARSVFAWQEAEFHLGRMLELLKEIFPSLAERDAVRRQGAILAERASVRYLWGKIAERDADLNTLIALAEMSGDEHLRLLALTQQVTNLNYGGRYLESIALAEEGLSLAERLNDPASRLRFLAQLGFAHYLLGQPRPALAALEPARALSEQTSDLETRGDVCRFLGFVHFHLGNYAQSLAHHQEALKCSRLLDNRTDLSWDFVHVGFLHLKLGEWEEAREHLNEGLTLALQIRVPMVEAYALTILGQWELYQGNYQAAADRFLLALPMHQTAHTEHSIGVTQELLGLAFYHLGDLAKARDWLEYAIESARRLGYRRMLGIVLFDLGLLEAADGHQETARRLLLESVASARECECQENLAKGLVALARVERLMGNLVLALDYAKESRRVAQEIRLPACEIWGNMEAGLTLLTLGDHAAALECTGRAVSLVSQANEGWIGTEQLHYAHAQCLHAVAQEDLAAEHEQVAREIIAAKAERIPDPAQRARFLTWASPDLPTA